ncbi:ESPR-type extended signal peptide-containing protein [Acinetobacter dispersus]|uniref:ESPR-type extended signal peptide-containing protein n=1 Tax=Acinetobacter dispersus TaxID=70348 RepID=UPI0021CD8C5C|nr:ESPR-type extended signal peptide-containing protein [Acinetobacter dispersus]MCU4338716.1 hypothetical protein [Acinetobacter dispersus]
MNKIYRLVWNKSLSLWTVVSENARGVTKKRNVVTNTSVKTVTSSSIQKYKQYQLKPSLIALTISSVFFTGNVFAATNTGGGAVSNNGSGNSMAISPTQSQCGSDGQASVNGNNGVAVGCGNSVGPVGSNSQGLVNRRGTGSNNYPTGPAGIVSSATAVGKNNKISNTGGASLFGTGNVSEGSGTFHNVGIGQGNLLGGPGYNTAIGIGNEAVTGASSVVIGTDNRSRGGTAIVMGRQSYADANYGISLGNTATVEEGATAGISVGHSALVSGVRGIAIGNSTASSNNQDTATAATASGTDAVAIGTTSNATANQTTAVGRRANAAGNNASAYGNQASAQGASSVAVGDSSNAQGDNDIAVGRNAATASGGSNNIAMGNGVTTGSTGQNVAIGSDGTTANSASADGGAVAIGRGQRARGDGAVAIGDPNTTNGNGAVAVGRNNTAAGDTAGNTAADGAVALGNENQAIGQGSVALGNASRAEQAGSIALGDTANAKAARGIALGSNAVANNADDVALGSGSTTSTASGAGFLTGTAAPTSVVSVGTAGNERRIQNLSDGAADTDAVNVRQLKSLKDIVDEQGDTTAAGLGGGSTYDPDTGTVTNPTYNVNGKDVNNVGAAITELDKGWNLQSNGANTGAVKAGDTVDIGTADGEENLQVAKDGNDIKYSLNRDLKVDSVKAGDTVINNDGMTIANGPSVTKSGIDAAGNTISNVADGVAGTDAVNKNQLDNAAAAAKTEVTEGKNITVTKTTGDDGQDIYNVATADDVEFNSVKAGDTVINNDGMTIAGGPSVTKDGIDAGNKTIGNVADGVADSDAVNKGQLDKSSQDLTDKGFGLTAQDGTTVQKKLGEAVEVVGADSNITTKVQDGKVAIELAKDLDVNSVKAGDTVINNDGMSIANGPSVTKSGIDAAGNTISNVGPGVAGTDAVNKDQLDNAAAAAKTEVMEGKNISVTKTTGDDGQDIYNVATADDVEFNNVKVGDTVINNDGMTIAGGPSVTKDGIDAGNKTIGNVADGVADSDAVNKGQLDKASQDLTDKGFGLTAQDGTTVQKKLGEAVEVVGADSNITTKVEDGKVAIELAKDLDVNSVKAGDTVINNDGMSIANGPSVTKSGINAAGNTISNVGPGVAGTDAVNKDQLDNAAAAAKTEVTKGKNITVTKTTGDDGQDIYNVATADDVEFNNVKVGDVTIDGTTGKISGVAAGDVNPDSTDAINGSQLANNAQSVADALGGGSTVNPDGTVSNPTYNINGTDTNNVGDALAELDKGWTLQSNGANAAAVKAGDTVDIGTADGEENLQVAKEGNDIKYSLNRDLKVDSVTAGDTVINNDGMSIANGPSVTKSGIDAAGNTISNVGPGVAGTDAVNKDQLDNAAAAAKTEVTEGKNITVTKTTGDDGQDIYNVATADDVEFNNVKVGDVTIDGTTGKISGVAAGDVNPDSTDAINGSQLANNAQSVADALGGGSTVNPDGTVSNPTYNINGTDTNNVGDALAELDKGWTLQSNGANAAAVKAGDTVDIGTADGEENLQVAKEGNDIKYSLNRDLKVDSVTAGDTVINNDGLSIANGPSVTKSGIDAGGQKLTNVAPGTVSADSTEGINGSQLHAQGEGVKNIIGGNTVYDPATGQYTNPDIGGTGENNINDAIGSLGRTAAAAKTEVEAGKNMAVESETGADGQTIYTVATADDVEFDSVKVGDVTIDGTTGKISGVAAGDVNPDSTDAINQLHDVADSVKNVVGGNTTVNPDGTISTSNVGGTGHNNINDAIASVKQDAQAAKSTVSNKDGNIKVNETTKADGSKDYEVGLAKDITVDSVTAKDVKANQVTVAGDQGTTNITGGGINITGPKGEAGPSMTTDGINAGGKKVTGVADGTIASGSKDAINGSQLHQSYQDVGAALGGGAGYDPEKGWKEPTYNVAGSNYNNVGDSLGALNQADQALDNRITNLGDQMQQAFYDTNRRIDDVEKKANAGVAAAIALEAAPFVAGKYTYAVGAAYHGGENAFGATLRKTADNGRWSLTGGVAAASQGDPSFRLGLSGVID